MTVSSARIRRRNFLREGEVEDGIVQSYRGFETHIKQLIHPADVVSVESLSENLCKQTLASLLMRALKLLAGSVEQMETYTALQSLSEVIKEENRSLLKENLESQDKITRLQEELLKDRGSKLQSFQTSIKSEMEGISSAVSRMSSGLSSLSEERRAVEYAVKSHHCQRGREAKGVDWSLNTDQSAESERRPGPSAPPRHAAGPTTKGIDWSVNRRSSDSTYLPTYPGDHTQLHGPGNHTHHHGTAVPIPPTVQSADPFSRWKDQFNRHYPDSTFARDTPSVMRVEIPKNRAFPVLGHATCPDCFDGGPHEITTMKKKDGILSVKKIPSQKCRKCKKLLYFVHGAEIPVKEAHRVNRPPPYHNTPQPAPARGTGVVNGGVARSAYMGHGWSYDDSDHGWNPRDGAGHGWACTE